MGTDMKNAIGRLPMAWGQEKGTDVKISALRACQYEIF